MRRWTAGLIGLALVSAVGASVVATVAEAKPARLDTVEPAPQKDDLPSAFELKRRESRKQALDLMLTGEAAAEVRGTSTVLRTGTKSPLGRGVRPHAVQQVDQYVELSREKTDKIFVVLVEFGKDRHPDYPDQDTDPQAIGPERFDGPLHNEIDEPDRTKDNSTLWRSDFSAEYFQNLYFGTGPGVESLRTYYEKQSSGRYSLDGLVTDWVKVRYNEARYGRSNGYPCDTNVCTNVYDLIPDALQAWLASRRAQGANERLVQEELASFDQWDRYDYDGDGDFNERDGYIDHFQVVHAGGDQASNDPYQGEDAIWSHRSYVYSDKVGKAGPSFNKLGGASVGDTGLWVGDYTMQPENGGLDVFAHEYGHDLGLPDHYDTTGATGNAENPVSWWTIMGQSRVSAVGDNAIGSRAADFSAWDKLQLGWLDHVTVDAGTEQTIDLGPHEYNSGKPQAALVVLPKKKVTQALPVPPQGSRQWWSGSGRNLANTLTGEVTLPAGPAILTFTAYWDIEDCGSESCDYAFVEVDSGKGFAPIPGSITKASEGNGIDGFSGGWVPVAFDLSAFAKKTISVRFRYVTDAAVHGQGLFVDDVKVAADEGTTLLADGAEDDNQGWSPEGFTAVGSQIVKEYDNYYLMSNRKWISYDQYLKSGPYNFGYQPDSPRKAEHFPYQEGLLISYWDTSMANNNTSEHRGQGLILPIDAHPKLLYRTGGKPWRPRVQGYDAPFSLNRASSFTLHDSGVASAIRGQAGVALFDDSRSYYVEDSAAGVYYGVKVPKNGIKIEVISQNGTSMTVKVYGDR